MARGLFVTFEGGEGAGKTTLISTLEQHLRDLGYAVVKTREPGGSELGERIRTLLLNQDRSLAISAEAELLLFLASRAQHIAECIGPALNSGCIVLCDRFNDSTIAYQGVARDLGIERVQQLCTLVCGPILPNLTFFLDLDPTEGLKRARGVHKEHSQAGHLDRIESERLAFHQKVRQGLQQLARQEPKRICTLDASQNADSVYAQALARLNPLLTPPSRAASP